jgi:hypothetical protein
MINFILGNYFSQKKSTIKHITGFTVFLTLSFNSRAQVDTLNTENLKLNIKAFKEGKSTYVVFFEDSAGNRTSSAAIWDRTLKMATSNTGEKIYQFGWKVWMRDSLVANVSATGLLHSMKPLSHDAEYLGRPSLHFVFEDQKVTIPVSKQLSSKDSSFNATLNPPAFEFPMDMELFAMMPFNKIGQKFVMAFYEPGRPESKYYPLTVTGKENLPLTGGQKVLCWLLRIDYAPSQYAQFWIADKTREVLKMQEYFRGKYRYKVKLY